MRLIAALAVVAATALTAKPDARESVERHKPRAHPAPAASTAPRRVRIGHTTRGRPLVATTYGNARARRRLLVVGCIHGDECSGTQVVRELPGAFCAATAGRQLDVWTVANLNPDGHALGVRVNGRGVDLNRNFSASWRAAGRPWDPEYSGRAPFSEPETLAIRRVVESERPTITIWFHQQARGLVRAWGRSIPAARRYARLIHLPFVRLPWLDGTAPNWQNHLRHGGASFVVELPLERLTPARARLLAVAIVRLAADPRRGYGGGATRR